MMLVASVAMKELTPLRTTRTPVMNPSAAPATTAAAKPTRTLVCMVTCTPMIAERASEALAVKSKTPLRMQMVAPVANSPTTAHWSNRLTRLRVVRKVLVLSDRATTIATRAIRMP